MYDARTCGLEIRDDILHSTKEDSNFYLELYK